MNNRYPALALLLSLPALCGAGEPASLTITVSGIRNTSGALIACIFRDSQGFPTCQKSRNAIRQTQRITGTTMTVRFDNLPPGTYVASVQHDEDGNGKLKTNFIGMPKEGVGISNNPGGMPRWSRSLFQHSGNSAISITMRYI
jgi:uncharacterized protein (DUF2141 family)